MMGQQDSASAPTLPIRHAMGQQDSASAPTLPIPAPVPTSGYLLPGSWWNLQTPCIDLQNTRVLA